MPITGSYCISKVNLQIECEDACLGQMVRDAISDYFYTEKSRPLLNYPNIILRFTANNFSLKVSPNAQEIYVSPSLRVLRDGDFCYLIGANSLFQLDLSAGLGIGRLDSNFWESSLKSKQEFLMLSILWLLRQHGLYALHAGGLIRDESGILIVGSSGSGKSTLGLSLIRQSWKYLSDDMILLTGRPNGIQAIGFQKGFSFDSHLADRYPELNRPSSFNGQKRFLDIDSIYPCQFVASCFPNILIFPKIVPQENSRLVPIDMGQALILLVENSGGIMLDKDIVVKQMEVLKQLIYQTSSYQLLAGHDLHEEPEKISEVLSGVKVI